MGSYIWHVQDSLTSGTAGSRCLHKAFQHLSLSIFQFWFSSVFTSFLGNLSVWWACAAPGPKLTRKRISPPNTSHRSLLLSCFGSDLDHKPATPTHCGQGNGVYRMAALRSWTHTWAMEQGCLWRHRAAKLQKLPTGGLGWCQRRHDGCGAGKHNCSSCGARAGRQKIGLFQDSDLCLLYHHCRVLGVIDRVAALISYLLARIGSHLFLKIIKYHFTSPRLYWGVTDM